MPLLELAVVTDGEDVVVRLSGEADLSTADQLAEELRAAAGLGAGALLLDAGSLRFCDCSGLRALASVVAELRSSGRHCRLVSASGVVLRLIELAGFPELLEAPTPRCTISAECGTSRPGSPHTVSPDAPR